MLERATISAPSKRRQQPLKVVAGSRGWLDYETRSCVDLRVVGSYEYAIHPSTEILCAAWAVGNGPVRLWLPGDPELPEELFAAEIIGAHGANFEYLITRYIAHPRHGWRLLPFKRFNCSMARCLAVGLPASLSKAADAKALANRKDAGGHRLMLSMTKPRRAHKNEAPGKIYWHEDEDRLQRLYAYCKQDVEVERELDGAVPELSAAEQQVFELDHRINFEHGFHVDRKLATAAYKIAQQAGPEIDAEITRLTDGAATSINQVARILGWARAHGYTGQSLDRDAIERYLAHEDLPLRLRQVLELRLGGAQSAARKFKTLLSCVGADDRVRGSLRYHGAGPGRWTGQRFQPQNLKRPATEDLDAAIAAVLRGSLQHLKKKYPQPLSLLGDLGRPTIVAGPGHVLLGGDFGAIESRTLAWLANENWKIAAYKKFDATQDPADEPYVRIASNIFGISPAAITKEQRKVGKTTDLAAGYQGGPNAYRAFSDEGTDDEVKALIDGWRATHPATVKFWRMLDRSAVLAVQNRDRIVRCGRIDFILSGAYLFMVLPSGRRIGYPAPELEPDQWGRLHFTFLDNQAGRFKRTRSYGGLICENATQGAARDLLAAALLRLDAAAANFRTVLHVHDEVLVEIAAKDFTDSLLTKFSKLLTQRPRWALDLPIAAEVWSGPRYTKT